MKAESLNIKFGDKRYITGLFLDIVDFTKFSEDLDPEEVDDIINLYFNLFANIIERNGGWIEKYIGDAIFAVFGKDVASTLDPYRASLSALQIIDACKKLNKKNKYEINIRIGIHSGLVAKSKRGSFEVLVGDTVNTASRIQHLANNNEILISSSINDNISEFFITEFKGMYNVKGKKDKLYIFKLIGKKKDIDKIVPSNLIFKRTELKEFLKFYIKNIFPISIFGPKKSGKTYFIFSIYHTLKELKNNNILFVSFNPIEKIDLPLFYKKISLELSNYLQTSFQINILNQDNYNINLNMVKTKIFKIMDKMENFIILIDNLNDFSTNLLEFLKSDEFLKFIKNKNISLVISSFKSIYSNNIYLGNMTISEISSYINFNLKETIATSIENKIIEFSNGNIGILTDICNIYKNNKKINFTSTVENLYLEIIDRLDETAKLILYIISLSFYPVSKLVLFKSILYFEKISYQKLDETINNLIKLNLVKFNNSRLNIVSTTAKEIINNTILKKNKKLIYKTLFNFEKNKLIKYFYAKLSEINYDTDFNLIKEETPIQEFVKIINHLFKENCDKDELKKFINEIQDIFCSLSILSQYKIEIDLPEIIKLSENINIKILNEFLNNNYLPENIGQTNLLNQPDINLLYNFLLNTNKFNKLATVYINSNLNKKYLFTNNSEEKFKNIENFYHEFTFYLSFFFHTRYLKVNPLKDEFDETNLRLKISKFFLLCSKILYLLNTNFIKQYKEILMMLNKLEKLAFDIDFKIFFEIYYFYLFLVMFLSKKIEFAKYFEQLKKEIIFFKDEYLLLTIVKNTIFSNNPDYSLKDLLNNLSISKIKLLSIPFSIYLIFLNSDIFNPDYNFSKFFNTFYVEFEKEILKTNIIENSFFEKVVYSLKKIFKKLI